VEKVETVLDRNRTNLRKMSVEELERLLLSQSVSRFFREMLFCEILKRNGSRRDAY
jgi:hypothetical protein